jgi:hypothetical protein
VDDKPKDNERQLTTEEALAFVTAEHVRDHELSMLGLMRGQVLQTYAGKLQEMGLDPNVQYSLSKTGLLTMLEAPAARELMPQVAADEKKPHQRKAKPLTEAEMLAKAAGTSVNG